MKSCSKNTKLITTLIVLTLLFLCAVNITFSYFSASAKVTCSVTLPNFEFKCAYKIKNNNTTKYVDSTQLEIYPAESQIHRGSVFTVNVIDGEESVEVDYIGCSSRGTKKAYVRFWIDAYVVRDGELDTTINYGKYFLVGYQDGGNFLESQEMFEDSFSKSNDTYFMIDAVSSGFSTCFKYVQLSPSAPVEMLGESLRVFVTMQGVQIENEAYKSVFDDEHGYCEEWGV